MLVHEPVNLPREHRFAQPRRQATVASGEALLCPRGINGTIFKEGKALKLL